MLWPELISYQPNDDAQCSCCSRSEKIYRVSIVWHSPFFPVNKFREIVQMATNRISSEQQTKLPFSIFLAVALTLISRFTFLCRLCRCLWVVHYDFMHSNQFSLSLARELQKFVVRFRNLLSQCQFARFAFQLLRLYCSTSLKSKVSTRVNVFKMYLYES